MKLNYVSVLREYRSKNRDGGYYVRGELESQPSALWFRQFQLSWINTPAYRKLCPEPQLNRNDILIPLSGRENISAAIEALRKVVLLVNEPMTDQEDSSYTQYTQAVN